MKRELKEVDKTIEKLRDMNFDVSWLFIWFTQKRVDIASSIGKKK
jgi:hypothetical protein